MPGFSVAKADPGETIPSTALRASVHLDADQRRGQGVRHLSHQHQHAGAGSVKLQHQVEEHQQVGEPHGGADVIEDMSDSVRQPQPGGHLPGH